MSNPRRPSRPQTYIMRLFTRYYFMYRGTVMTVRPSICCVPVMVRTLGIAIAEGTQPERSKKSITLESPVSAEPCAELEV